MRAGQPSRWPWSPSVLSTLHRVVCQGRLRASGRASRGHGATILVPAHESRRSDAPARRERLHLNRLANSRGPTPRAGREGQRPHRARLRDWSDPRSPGARSFLTRRLRGARVPAGRVARRSRACREGRGRHSFAVETSAPQPPMSGVLSSLAHSRRARTQDMGIRSSWTGGRREGIVCNHQLEGFSTHVPTSLPCARNLPSKRRPAASSTSVPGAVTLLAPKTSSTSFLS